MILSSIKHVLVIFLATLTCLPHGQAIIAAQPPSPSPPALSCPVGETVTSALFFGVAKADLSATAMTVADNPTEAERLVLLRNQMKDLVYEDVDNMAEADLLDLASIYYSLRLLEVPANQLKISKESLRLELETKVLGEGELTTKEEEFLTWTIGKLGDQEVVLLSCGVHFVLPLAQLNNPVHCYTTMSRALKQKTVPSGSSCKMVCRAEEHLYAATMSDDCYCTSSVDSFAEITNDRENCASSNNKVTSTGLGWHASVRLEEFKPTDFPYVTTDTRFGSVEVDTPVLDFVDAKTFKDKAGQLTVVLYKTHCVLFKVTAEPLKEEIDEVVRTDVQYMDHRRWDSAAKTDIGEYKASHKWLLKQSNEYELLSPDSSDQSWEEVLKPSATSVTILPIFVKVDEKFYHHKAFDYDGDYDESNYAGRPIPEGKWFNHILISHEGKSVRKRRDTPYMTLIRILDDGTLLHILDMYNGQGQFEVEDFLLKEPTDILALTRGRNSFTMVASHTPITRLPSSSVKGFKIVEEINEPIYKETTNYFKAEPLDFEISVFNEAKLGFVDFLFTSYLVVLDRSALDGSDSRLRFFQFSRLDGGEYNVDTMAASTQEFTGIIFTKMHSFIKNGDRYLVLIKSASSNGDTNEVKLFLVDIEGQLVSKLSVSDTNGILIDVKPADTGVPGNEIELVEVRKIASEGNLNLQCSNYVGEWTPKSTKAQVKSKQLNIDVGTMYNDDLYTTVEVFHLKSRVYGMMFRNKLASANDANNLIVDMVRINAVRMPVVDNRLKKESDLVAKINLLERRIVSNSDSLSNKFIGAKANIDKYVKDSNSIVTANWNIKTLRVGRVLETNALPSDTTVTVKIKNDPTLDSVAHTTDNFRNVVDINLGLVASKLETVSSNIADLQVRNDDLLLLDTGSSSVTQTVQSKLILDNLIVQDTFKLVRDSSGDFSPDLKITTLAKGADTLAMALLSNIFSAGHDHSISGLTTLSGKVSAVNLITPKLSADEDGSITEVTTANLLKYDEDRSFPKVQIFNEAVTVTVNMGFDSDKRGVDAETTQTVIDFNEDIFELTKILGDIKFAGTVTVNGLGLTAAKLETNFVEGLDVSKIVLTNETNVEIKGKLIINAMTPSSLSASGESIGIVNGMINKHNTDNLYRKAAWISAPASISSISDDSTITFTTNIAISKPINVNNDVSVTKINDLDFAKYILATDWNSNNEILVGGRKTLKSSATFADVVARTINSRTLDKFVTKSTEQDEFVYLNTFSKATTLKDIVAGLSSPTIDGKNLASILSNNLPGVIAGTVSNNKLIGANIQFSKLKISQNAEFKLTGKMNDIDLADRVANIVVNTEEIVTILGEKTFGSAVTAAAVSFNTVKSKKEDGTPVPYKMGDFVNKLNSQIISGNKHFSKAVTFADMFIVGDDTKINTVKAAPLLQCWIDRLSDQPYIEIENKVHFTHLITPGLNISREDEATRDCVGLTDTLSAAASWAFPDETSTDDLRSRLVTWLSDKAPDSELTEATDNTGDGGIPAITFFTTILFEEMGVDKSELKLMSIDVKREMVHHFIYKKFGMKVTYVHNTKDYAIAAMTCRRPELNSRDVKTDLALLDQDNDFCSEESRCGQTFNGGFVANRLTVGGKLSMQPKGKIFGVDLSNLEETRASLTKSQTWDGSYHFRDLRLKTGGQFTGDISFEYNSDSLSLGNFIAKFLKKSKAGKQIFTQARNVKKIEASTAVTTGTGAATNDVIVRVQSLVDKSYNIKKIYDVHPHLDQTFTTTAGFTFNGEVTVSMNVDVRGTVDGVNIKTLAADLVLTGNSVQVTDGSDSYVITGVDSGSVAFIGTKTFSVAPTITKNIAIAQHPELGLIPTVDTTTTKGITFVSGQTVVGASTKIMTNSLAWTYTGSSFSIGGNVLLKGDLNTATVDGVAVSEINGKYKYDADSSAHELLSAFNFLGDLVITNLVADTVNGRNWDNFVIDAMPRAIAPGSASVVVTGVKKFSGDVTLEQKDTNIGHFNKNDLSTEYAAAAFINEETSFTGSNNFKGAAKTAIIANGEHLFVKTALTLTDSSTTAGNLEWLYTNTVKKSDTTEYPITGKLKFTNDVTLGGSSIVGTLAELNQNYELTLPDSLVKLDTTSFTTSFTSPNTGDRQFASVTLNKDTKVDGQLAGHDLTEFSAVLYKTGDQIMSGKKTFAKTVKMTNAVTSTGTVNGINLRENLVYLDNQNTVMDGLYTFNYVGLKNLGVTGTIDGIDFDGISGKLLYRDTAQTVDATYTFNEDLTFSGDILGDGNAANGEGEINGQSIASLKAVGNTWLGIAAVKVSAQAEANVLCSHVSSLGEAYFDNMEVSYYTEKGSVSISGPAVFTDIQMVQLGEIKIGLALSGTTIHHLFYLEISGLISSGISLDLKIKAGGAKIITGATSLVVVNDLSVYDSKKNSYDLIALVVCDQGMLAVKVTGDGKETTISQFGDPIPDVVAVSRSNEGKHVLFLKMTTVSSSGSPSHTFELVSVSKSKLADCATTGNCCSQGDCSNWSQNILWTGSAFRKTVTPSLDIAFIPSTNKVVVAISDGMDSVADLFVRIIPLVYTSGTRTLALSNDEKFLVPVDLHDFVLVTTGDVVYLVSGGMEITTTKLMWTGTRNWELVSNLKTIGMATKLKIENKETVSMMEGAQNVVFLKYSGVNGMQMDRRVYSTKTPLDLYSTILSPSKASDNVLMTTSGNEITWYVSTSSFTAEQLGLKCRDPEVSQASAINPYCAVNADHTMCILDKPSETCSILRKDLPQKFKDELLNLHNSFRSTVAAGNTGVTNLPQASNMRQMVWSNELEDTAQMWANQCTPGHDQNRDKLQGGQVGQNVLAFKGLLPWEVTTSTMTEVVKYWYNEVKDMKTTGINTFEFDDATGHFTQLAWAATDQLGCGWTQYVDPEEEHPHISLVVCNYHTTGNVVGQSLWEAGDACADCPDNYICENNLCSEP